MALKRVSLDIVKQLEPSELEELAYILKGNFPGKFHYILSLLIY